MPVRHKKKSASSYLGWVYLSIAGRHLRHESTLERDFLHYMRFIPSLIRIEEQPVRISDRERTYTPDFNLELRTEPSPFQKVEFTHLIEIKPFGVLQRNWEKLRPRIEIGLEYAQSRGWNFKILTELEIRTDELKIIQFLMSHIRIQPDPSLTVWILEKLEAKPTTLLDLLLEGKNTLGLEPRSCLPTIWHLIAVRAIYLSSPPALRYQSIIYHPKSQVSGYWIPGDRMTRILSEPWEIRPRIGL